MSQGPILENTLTLYMQQLGRGMKKCDGKEYLMVFDLIDNAIILVWWPFLQLSSALHAEQEVQAVALFRRNEHYTSRLPYLVY